MAEQDNILEEVIEATRPDKIIPEIFPRLPKPPSPDEVLNNLFGEKPE